MEKRENWEKNFSGLKKLNIIEKTELDNYLEAAKATGVRMEYKTISASQTGIIKQYEIWTPPDFDLTEFWNCLSLFDLNMVE